MDLRSLTIDEIERLERQGCTAEDWAHINVAEDFETEYVRQTDFYGSVTLGVFDKMLEVSGGFRKHAGISRAVLRDVAVGNNCLIENIGNYINNYTIGEECVIANVDVMETTEGATFGEGNMISVLNEAGEGNVIIFDGLTAPMAALMLRHAGDRSVLANIRKLVKDYLAARLPERGTVGDGVKITNTGEITNTVIGRDCEVSGACRLSDCTLKGSPDAGVYIGSGVICESTVVTQGSSVRNYARLDNCFVGEACQISNGFSADSSLFFVNSQMANGEACAVFCGPFSSSHHKSTLLIGGMYSFYNAGSASNFSNHAYKMGPIHYGTLGRGTKTASSSHILWPANIGAYTVCLGKLTGHPDTSAFPFSYLIGDGQEQFLLPGRNIATVGLFRDIKKWPKRDLRPKDNRQSEVVFDWLNPMTIGALLKGQRLMNSLLTADESITAHEYRGLTIKTKWLRDGIKYYDTALRLFIGAMIQHYKSDTPKTPVGAGEWTDLAGLLMPEEEENRLVEEIKDGTVNSVDALLGEIHDVYLHYPDYRWTWTYRFILNYYGLDSLTEDDLSKIRQDYIDAYHVWTAGIRDDAEKEFDLGDVPQDTLDALLREIGGK